MLGGVVDNESFPNLRSHLGTEGVGQRLLAMDVEVVQHQMDSGGLRIRHGEFQCNQGELKPGPVWRGKAEMLACFGFHGKERIRAILDLTKGISTMLEAVSRRLRGDQGKRLWESDVEGLQGPGFELP